MVVKRVLITKVIKIENESKIDERNAEKNIQLRK